MSASGSIQRESAMQPASSRRRLPVSSKWPGIELILSQTSMPKCFELV